jgi:photosystem II stability/assembly factor-like uncharacterized protein
MTGHSTSMACSMQRILRVSAALVVSTALTCAGFPGPRAAAFTIDNPPLYGWAAIMRGNAATDVANRLIAPSSLVFLTDDTTSWPSSDVSIRGVRENNQGPGFFTVSTLDQSLAPSSGIPFNYLVLNATSGTIDGLSYLAGRATIPSGAHNAGVTLSGVTATSIILLTVDASSISGNVVLPGLKINNKGSGFFTVTTLGLEAAPSTGIPFNYLVVNPGFATIYTGTGRVPAGVTNTGVNTQSSNNPAGVFLTVDATTIPGADVALPGVKVNNHGAGFFTITTTGLTNAPSTGVPFDWLVVEPPARWEELGPTGTSGNVWTIQPDPSNTNVAYTGSSGGGVWKTLNGGQTWLTAWNQALVGIYRLAMMPGDHNTLYALDANGLMWVTHDAAASWTKLVQPQTSHLRDTSILVAGAGGTVYVCTAAGLEQLSSGGTFWQHIEPGTDTSCTDVAVGSDGTVYAAFRNSGVYRQPPSQAWARIKGVATAGDTVRIAVGASHLVVNDDQTIFTNTIPTLSTWVKHDGFCGEGEGEGSEAAKVIGSQDGYDLSVAVSPTNDNHFLAFSHCGSLTTDGGTTVFPDGVHNPGYLCPDKAGHLVQCKNLHVGQDDHQVVFTDDQHAFLATDNGPRFSTDGGVHWGDTTVGTSRITDGPPIADYYNLNVSGVDQFGRVFLAGNVQDHGATAIVGRSTGFLNGGGEQGVTVGAAHPVNSADTQFATWRYYDTDNIASTQELDLCSVSVPGPDYLAPSFFDDENEYPRQDRDPCPNVTLTLPNGALADHFPDAVWAVATSPDRIDRALVGLGNGDVYRSTPGQDGYMFDRIVAHPEGTSVPVRTIRFSSATTAYVGYVDGALYKITNLFTSPSPPRRLMSATTAGKVVDIAAVGETPAELYVAYPNVIYKSTDDGLTWSNVTGSGELATQLTTGSRSIVGLAFDTAHPFLYVATGTFGGGSVFRSPRPASGTWTRIDDGLPSGIPISGIGIAPDRALYISTQGRGVWWRRDIAAVPPNSGVNTPARGSSRPGERFTIVTTCSDPAGWHHIASLDFTLARGHGAEEGNPVALRLEYDENRNVIRLFDPALNRWTEGVPGSHGVLRSRYAIIRLADTLVVGIGSDTPKTTVQISWAIQLHGDLSGELQQWLRVTDDGGNSTTWDKVGQWQVGVPTGS